jgi:hypothetical protein
MQAGRRSRAARAMALLVIALPLAACATGADVASTGSTAAHAAPGIFPAVHDMPPARPNTTLSDAEQQQAQRELLSAHDSQVVKAQQGVQPIDIDPPPARTGSAR